MSFIAPPKVIKEAGDVEMIQGVNIEKTLTYVCIKLLDSRPSIHFLSSLDQIFIKGKAI